MDFKSYHVSEFLMSRPFQWNVEISLEVTQLIIVSRVATESLESSHTLKTEHCCLVVVEGSCNG